MLQPTPPVPRPPTAPPAPAPPRITIVAPAALPYAALRGALTAARDRGVTRVTVVVVPCPSTPCSA